MSARRALDTGRMASQLDITLADLAREQQQEIAQHHAALAAEVIAEIEAETPHCADCGVPIERDHEASCWERREVWIDPNLLDQDNAADHCLDDDESMDYSCPHRIAA